MESNGELAHKDLTDLIERLKNLKAMTLPQSCPD